MGRKCVDHLQPGAWTERPTVRSPRSTRSSVIPGNRIASSGVRRFLEWDSISAHGHPGCSRGQTIAVIDGQHLVPFGRDAPGRRKFWAPGASNCVKIFQEILPRITERTLPAFINDQRSAERFEEYVASIDELAREAQVAGRPERSAMRKVFLLNTRSESTLSHVTFEIKRKSSLQITPVLRMRYLSWDTRYRTVSGDLEGTINVSCTRSTSPGCCPACRSRSGALLDRAPSAFMINFRSEPMSKQPIVD